MRPITLWLIITATLGIIAAYCLPAYAQTLLPHNIPELCATAPASDKVPAGQTVTLSGAVTKGCLEVKGLAIFADGIDLTVTTILQHPGSEVRWGTAQTPSRGRVRFASVAPTDPEQFGTGWISLGKTSLYGMPKTEFARLSADALAGQNQIRLDVSPTGWIIGDVLRLPDTRQWINETWKRPAEWQIEDCTIAGVSGSTVTCAQPLRFNHGGVTLKDGTTRILGHVANLTRSITISSVDPNGTRGHVMFAHGAEVVERYAAFVDLGRTRWDIAAGQFPTNQLGRYANHKHYVMTPVNSFGNVILNARKWGLTVHASNNGSYYNNVIANAGGAGIMTEDGTETGNVFDHNLVIGTVGTGDDRGDQRQAQNDWGWEGSCGWFRAATSTVRNNIFANCNGHAVTYMPIGAPDVTKQQPLDFTGNEIYSSYAGLTLWHVGAKNECCEVLETPAQVVKDTTLWHLARQGYFGYGTNRLVFENWRQYGHCGQLYLTNEGQPGMTAGDYIARNTTIIRSKFECLRTGIHAFVNVGDPRDIYGNVPGTFDVIDTDIHATTGIYRTMMFRVSGAIAPRLITLRNVRFSTPSGDLGGVTSTKIYTHWANDQGGNVSPQVSDRMVFHDLNGNTADDGEIYYLEQATQAIAGTTPPITGATTRPDIRGLVVGGAVQPPPPPPPAEICGDGIDNDKDGQIDEGCPLPPPPQVEICGDNIDNDNDGQVDEGCAPPPPTDSDGDGVNDSLDQCPGTPPGSTVDATGCVPIVPPSGLVTVLNVKNGSCRPLARIEAGSPYPGGGGTVTFMRNGAIFGKPIKSAPYQFQGDVPTGTNVFTAVWTKTGQPNVTSQPFTFTCPQ